ncbi:MAG: response regulator [Bacteroidia bacterium]|nr:response regulator [Bacteroidia bacterium]
MKKILLIEDNPEMRENTCEILELAGYKVTTAVNGKIGVEAALRDNPDLIICDIMMPELDGYGVLHMLGTNPATASIPFIFLTAKAEKSDYRKGMSMGADDYLTKPFDDMELLTAVEIRLKKSEKLKGEFSRDAQGLDQFLEDAVSLEVIVEKSEKRRSRKIKKKENIYHEGTYPNGIFFLSEGKVKTFRINADGKEFITGLFQPGDFFGYNALLEGLSYQDSATALEEVELVFIPKEDFSSLLSSSRELAVKFIRMLSNNIREMEERLLKLAYNSVRKRVAEALVMLHDKYKSEGPDPFKITISRDDLANIVGTASETVIRTLSDFKEEQLIAIKGGTITVLNYDKLKNMKN